MQIEIKKMILDILTQNKIKHKIENNLLKY